MSYKINDNCIGCTLCFKNCPVFAIEGSTKRIHKINEKRCIECGVCGRVCPAKAITDNEGNTLEKIAKSEWKKPVINKEKCSACSLCVDVCFLDCLKISSPSYKGDINNHAELAMEKECVSCSMCMSICPLEAITMKEASI